MCSQHIGDLFMVPTLHSHLRCSRHYYQSPYFLQVATPSTADSGRRQAPGTASHAQPNDQALMQAVIQHSRMPAYLRTLYTEMLELQAGSSSWTWQLDFVLPQFQVVLLCSLTAALCASSSLYPTRACICALKRVGSANDHVGCLNPDGRYHLYSCRAKPFEA